MAIHIDRFSKARRRSIFIIAIAYFIFQALELDMSAKLIGWTPGSGISELVENIGFGIYFLGIVALGYSYWRLSKSDNLTRAAAHDDLVKHHINLAMQFGFKVLMFAGFLLFILQQTYDISGEDTARIFFTLSLAVPYFKFAWLEMKHA